MSPGFFLVTLMAARRRIDMAIVKISVETQESLWRISNVDHLHIDTSAG